MTRFTCLKRLFAAGVLAMGVLAACPTRRGEAPPLAPRPELIPPIPSPAPVPGATDPIRPGDAGTPSPAPSPGPVSLSSPELRAFPQRLAADAGTPRADAAPHRPDAGLDATVPLDASPLDAQAPSLPPVPDAPLAPDAGRPY